MPASLLSFAHLAFSASSTALSSTRMDVLPLGLSLFEVLVVTLSWLAVGLFGMWCLNVFKPFHASKSKAWTIACTVVYLATFVVSGSLFELMVFEIYDFLPRPARLRYWRFALALLSVLLKAIGRWRVFSGGSSDFEIFDALTCACSQCHSCWWLRCSSSKGCRACCRCG